MRYQIRADMGKVAAGLVRVALYHAHGQVALPHNAVAGAGDLCGQHLVELVAVFVQTIILVGQQDAALELGLVDRRFVATAHISCESVRGCCIFPVHRILSEFLGGRLFPLQ